MSSWLGDFAQDVDLLSISYENCSNSVKKNSQMCEVLVEKLFMPLISKDGQKLDITTACKNMRRINMFGHCAGVYDVANTLVTVLQEKISNLGYTKEENDKLISQLFLVSYGSNYTETRVPTVDILSVADEYFLESKRLQSLFIANLDNIVMSESDRQILKSLNETQIYKFLRKNTRRCYVLPDGNTIKLISANFSNDNDSDHAVAQLRMKKGWKRGELASLTGENIAKCIGASLCNAVANSMLNMASDRLIEFDLNELRWQLEEICKKLNRKYANIELEAYLGL